MRRRAFQGLRSLFSHEARKEKSALAKRRDDDELREEEARAAMLRLAAVGSAEDEKRADDGDGGDDSDGGSAVEAIPQPGCRAASADDPDRENDGGHGASDPETNFAIPPGEDAAKYYKRLWRAEQEKRLRLEEELREQKALNRRNADRQRNERVRVQERQRTAQRSKEKAGGAPTRSPKKEHAYAVAPDDALPEKHGSSDDFGMGL